MIQSKAKFSHEENKQCIGVNVSLPEKYNFEDEKYELDTQCGYREINPILKELCFPKLLNNHEDRMAKKLCSWDREVAEMRKKVKSIQGEVSRNEKIQVLYNLPKIDESWKPKISNTDFNSYLKEIEKMDAILKIKTAEEKKVKLSRLQMEEETKEILMELPSAKLSNAIKINSQEFLNLLTESDRGTIDEKEDSLEEKLECGKSRKKDNNEAYSGPKFILRNIQLAKCGRGTLSVTEDEELRIQSLLKDIDAIEEDSKKEKSEKYEDIYALDEEIQSKLSIIDKRLQEFVEKKSVGSSASQLSVLTKITVDNDKIEDGGKKEGNKKRKKKKKVSRLREINNLLKYFNSETNEEIDPLPQEDIEFLIEEAKRNIGEFSESIPDEEEKEEQEKKEDDCLSVKTNFSQETVAELVASAKSLMPKFKYRYYE